MLKDSNEQNEVPTFKKIAFLGDKIKKKKVQVNISADDVTSDREK